MFTDENRKTLEEYLRTHHIPRGLGNKEGVCSLAAINLAIDGVLTDDIPDCMSYILGEMTIKMQDYMPDHMRNSGRFKRLLLDMPCTGRTQEKERLAIFVDWLYSTILPSIQHVADSHGFGDVWHTMCRDRSTGGAGYSAISTTDAFVRAAVRSAVRATYAVNVVTARAVNTHDNSITSTCSITFACSINTVIDAVCLVNGGSKEIWERIDPVGALERATYLPSGELTS